MVPRILVLLSLTAVPALALAEPDGPPPLPPDPVAAYLVITKPVESEWARGFPDATREARIQTACNVLTSATGKGRTDLAGKAGLICSGGLLRLFPPPAPAAGGAKAPAASGAKPATGSAREPAAWEPRIVPAIAEAMNYTYDAFVAEIKRSLWEETILLKLTVRLDGNPLGPVFDRMRRQRAEMLEREAAIAGAVGALAERNDAHPLFGLAALRMSLMRGDCDTVARLTASWPRPGDEVGKALALGAALCSMEARTPCGVAATIPDEVMRGQLARPLLKHAGQAVEDRIAASCGLRGLAEPTDLRQRLGVDSAERRERMKKKSPRALASIGVDSWPWAFGPKGGLSSRVLALPEPESDDDRSSTIDILATAAAVDGSPPEVLKLMRAVDAAELEKALASKDWGKALSRVGLLVSSISIEAIRAGTIKVLTENLDQHADEWTRLLEIGLDGLRVVVLGGMDCGKPGPLNLGGALCGAVDAAFKALPGELVASVRACAGRLDEKVILAELERLGRVGLGIVKPVLDLPDLKKRTLAFEAALWKTPKFGEFLKAVERRFGPRSKDSNLAAIILDIADTAATDQKLLGLPVQVKEPDLLVVRGALAFQVRGQHGLAEVRTKAFERLKTRMGAEEPSALADYAMAVGLVTWLDGNSQDAVETGRAIEGLVKSVWSDALPGASPRYGASLCAIGILLQGDEALKERGVQCHEVDPGDITAAIVASVADEKRGQPSAAVADLILAHTISRVVAADERGRELLLRRLAVVAKKAGDEGLAAEAEKGAREIHDKLYGSKDDKGGTGLDEELAKLWARVLANDPKGVFKALETTRSGRMVRSIVKALKGQEFRSPLSGTGRLGRQTEGTFQIGFGTVGTRGPMFNFDTKGLTNLVPVDQEWLLDMGEKGEKGK